MTDHPFATQIRAAQSALATNKLQRCYQILHEILRADQRHPQANRLLASCYLAAGNPEAAIDHFRISLEQQPADAQTLLELITAYRLHGSSSMALQTTDDLLRDWPELAMAHVHRGNILADTQHREAAAASFRRAIQLDPECAEAWLSLVLLGADEAATISTEQQHELACRTQAFNPSLDAASKRQQSLLHFCLARLLDSQHSYDHAFRHFCLANQYRKSLLQSSDRFNPVSERDRLRKMHVVAKQNPKHSFGTPNQSNSIRPVFIVGMLRTGTTLLETLLSRHPQIAAGGEMMHIKLLIRDKLPRATGHSYPELLDHLNPVLARMAAKHYLEQAKATAMRMDPDIDMQEVRFIIDKMPSNYQDLGLISALFPDAIIVHTTREPMDTLWSCFRENLSATYSNDMQDLLDYYALYKEYMRLWEQTGIPMHHLSYEQLVSMPEKCLQQLLNCLGLPHTHLTATQHRATLTNTASAQQVRQPINTQAIGKWKLYEQHLRPWQQKLAAIEGASGAQEFS